MSYLVATMQKYKQKDLSSVGGESVRNLKNYKNKVDPKKENENVYWRKDGQTDNFRTAIEREIFSRWTKNKTPRKDAVRMVGLVVSTSPEMFEGLGKDAKLELAERFAKDSTEYVKERFGEDNLFSAALHMDETTPHIHFGIVPMIDGGLNCKTLFNRNALRDLHDGKHDTGFITFLNKRGWNLEVEPKDASAKHIDPDKYHASLEQLNELDNKISTQKRVLGGMQKKADNLYKESGTKGYDDGYTSGVHMGKKEMSKKIEALDDRERALDEREVNLESDAYINAQSRLEVEKQRIEDEKERLADETKRFNREREAFFVERDAQTSRMQALFESLELPQQWVNALKNHVVKGITGLTYKTTAKPVPYDRLTKKVTEEKAKQVLNKIVINEHIDDGPEL